jgi:membrane protein required for colicin V production
MNWADWTIVAIISFSCLVSIARGFVKEAISLVIWGFAFVVAVTFQERLAVLFESSVNSVSIRYLLSFVVLFVATLVVGALVKYLLGQLVKMTGLSSTDRLFGMAFGLARGVIIVMAILILAPLAVPVDQDIWWQQSLLIPQFLLMEQWCKDTFEIVLSFFERLIP